MGQTNQFVYKKLSFSDKFRRAINFIRYCLHGDISIVEMLKIWNGPFLSYLLFPLSFGPSLLLALNDYRRGVVVKTHLEFKKASQNVQVTHEVLKG